MSKLYVADYGSNDITVIAPAAVPGQKPGFHIEKIPVDFHPLGLALDKTRGRLYVTGANEVCIFHTKTQAGSKRIRVGRQPLHPGLNAAGDRLYVPNHGSNTLSVIDTILDKVTAVVPMGGKPFQAIVDPADKYIYVTNSGADTVYKVSTKFPPSSPKPKPTPPPRMIKVSPHPRGIAMDASGRFAYVVCKTTQQVGVIDTALNRVIDYMDVDKDPFGIAIGRAPDQLWVTNRGSNTVSVLDPNTHNPLAIIQVDVPLQVSILGPFAFVTAFNLNQVIVIDRSSYQKIDAVGVGLNPDDVIAA